MKRLLFFYASRSMDDVSRYGQELLMGKKGSVKCS